LAEVIELATNALENFEPHNATGAINVFLDDLTNWYLRRSRRRFWAKAGASDSSDADKEAAYQTLYGVLVELIKVLAPFVPFVTETMYQNLVSSEQLASVHHNGWPTVDPSTIDPKLTAEMALVKRLVSLGHAARNQAQIRLRQPLREAAFAVARASEREVVSQYSDIIREELNVKEVRLLDAVREAAEYQLKPLPMQLGQKYGAKFPAIRGALLELDADSAAQQLLNGESIELEIESQTIKVLPSEVEVQISPRKGFTAAAEGAYVAALVIEIDQELLQEGLANEVIRRVQELRKQKGFSVSDRIHFRYDGTSAVTNAIVVHQPHIETETLSLPLERITEPIGAEGTEYEFQEEKLTVVISKSEQD
jgi:isoleucyl-tRNA synthetase